MRSHDAAISAQIQRLAVKIEGRVLIAAGAARSAAELSKRHRGHIPVEAIERTVAGFERALTASLAVVRPAAVEDEGC